MPDDDNHAASVSLPSESGDPPVPGTGAQDEGPDLSGPVANERRITELGLFLIGLFLLQGVTLINVTGMSFLHITVGVAVLGVVLVKLGSVANRFLRYYLKDEAYRAVGPPRLLPRLLAPALIAATMALLFSGIGILVRFGDPGMVRIHLTCFWIWSALVLVHLLVYLPTVRRTLFAAHR